MATKSKNKPKGGAFGSRPTGHEGSRRQSTRTSRRVVRPAGPPQPLLTRLLNRFQTRSMFFALATFMIGLLGFASSIWTLTAAIILPEPSLGSLIWQVATSLITIVLGVFFMIASVRNIQRIQEAKQGPQ